MISAEANSFSSILNEILDDLSHHHRSRSELKLLYLNERLSKSLITYYRELIKTFEYLSYREEDNLMREYKRVMK